MPDDTRSLFPVPVPTPAAALDPASAAARLLAAFLASRSAATLRSYGGDLRDFTAFCSVPTVEAAAAFLLGRGPGAANELALHYMAHLAARGLSANTVNRRLAA